MIAPLYSLFDSLLTQIQNQEAFLKLMLILNHLIKLSDDEPGLQKWKMVEKAMTDFLEGKIDNLEDKIIENDTVISEKDKIIDDKDLIIKGLNEEIKEILEKNKKQLNISPTKDIKFINRRITKT